ncbi:DUF5777 family beta-barrel protein [Sediminibacterium sp.]|uniref:DUF5777 family beta-barrel protein n=1 Tax=Sediminibacterium sp. TaxID=1917865 RepID=UPI002735FDD7|nr:DUF5777 family beta-barrel protein [Sediminibacterium sp.]MDP3394276.1 DUF5777 family beta-barrel protein [Sediminibacterium sp.]MDP3568111.1 DUF5777 family beta-barrel protein [Sediminibacterium sp.]
MKKNIFHNTVNNFSVLLLILVAIGINTVELVAQDSTAVTETIVKKKSYTRNTFEGNFLIDNQTVMVPIKGTFEFDIYHRFAPIDKGFTDLFGLFGSANMRLGFSYSLLNDLQIGFGANNHNMQVDFNAKYAIVKQTRDNAMPVSVTFFGDIAMDTRAKSSVLPIVNTTDRLSYFSQIMVARKISEKFSLQGSINYTHFNNVEGYLDDKNVVQPKMKNDHLSFALTSRYKISPKTSIVFNYEQPLTTHYMNNPKPNLSLGLDMKSSGHDFQVFFGNYGYTVPQNNSFLNQNDYAKGQYVIGFNMSRLWNF